MKASAPVLARRRAAVCALLAAEAAPGVGAFSIPVIAELLGIPEPTARSDAAKAARAVPACTHRVDRRGHLYPLGPRWHGTHNHTEEHR